MSTAPHAPHGYCAICMALGKPDVPAIDWIGIPICDSCHQETLRQVRAEHRQKRVTLPSTGEELLMQDGTRRLLDGDVPLPLYNPNTITGAPPGVTLH